MSRICAARQRKMSGLLRPFGITLAQFELVWLTRRRGAIAPSFAAAELDCDRPTMTLVARKCVAEGWIRRRRSESDRRSIRLELSGAGEEILDRIESSRVLSPASFGDPLDVLEGEERSRFEAALRKVHRRALDIQDR